MIDFNYNLNEILKELFEKNNINHNNIMIHKFFYALKIITKSNTY